MVRRPCEAYWNIIKQRGRGTNPPNKGDRNKKMTLTKDFKDGLMDIEVQIDVQASLSQLNIHAQGNK